VSSLQLRQVLESDVFSALRDARSEHGDPVLWDVFQMSVSGPTAPYFSFPTFESAVATECALDATCEIICVLFDCVLLLCRRGIEGSICICGGVDLQKIELVVFEDWPNQLCWRLVLDFKLHRKESGWVSLTNPAETEDEYIRRKAAWMKNLQRLRKRARDRSSKLVPTNHIITMPVRKFLISLNIA